MTVILSSIIGALLVLSAILLALFIGSARSLARYKGIADIERYKSDCERQAQAANAECEQHKAESCQLNERLVQQKEKVEQYQRLLGKLKTAADLQERIQTDTGRVKKIAATLGKLERASQLDEYVRKQDSAIAHRTRELDELAEAIGGAKSASEIAAQVQYYDNYLQQIRADIEAVEEAGALQEFGYYRPRYDFGSSAEYKARLDQIRQSQKDMLKAKLACVCNTEWTVEGSKHEGKKMVDQQIKLMLRAYNGESEAAVSKARYNNVVSLENRMTKSFEKINKLGETKRIYLAPQYYNLKLEELHLAYEYQNMKQEEKEEQRRIREQMREEEKVVKEVAKAQEAAEKDESLKAVALEMAREELAHTAGQQTEKLKALVTKLEHELSEAIDRKAKAIARAQLTKSGHVYVLSNIGSFGEGIYKIGLTRRLEPLERVKELGDASVPFFFDVHAMIYSEDAPSLENALHKYFASRRVNMINLRREFFRVSLDEIRAAVAKNFGQVTFVTVPDAAQFRETLAMRKEQELNAPPLQIA